MWPFNLNRKSPTYRPREPVQELMNDLHRTWWKTSDTNYGEYLEAIAQLVVMYDMNPENVRSAKLYLAYLSGEIDWTRGEDEQQPSL